MAMETSAAVDLERIETKLAAARTRLILDKPFLGALVLRLPMQAARPDWCPTTATDARAFYYNPEYIASLSIEQTQFMLAHEALHCALSHFARRQHRVQHRWDLACDYAINPLLIDDGLKPPPNSLHMPLYKGMTAEEIYPLLDENDQAETLDRHAYDPKDGRSPPGGVEPKGGDSRGEGKDQAQGADRGMREGDVQRSESRPEPEAGHRGNGLASPQPEGQHGDGAEGPSGEPEPLTPDERETLAVQWQQRMAGAAQQAMQAGKLGGELRRMIDHLLQPQLPWRMLLARYMSALARDDYSYSRPSRREGDFIMPSLRSQQLDLIVAVDTSGSIKDAEVEEFIDEIDALKGQVRARVTLLPCDAKLCEGAPWVFEPWDAFRRPEGIKGGGGTSFTPVFDWVDQVGRRPDLLVYFTDADGTFPKAEPPYPVIWLVKGKSQVPWGLRIQLN
jgi:predicted metal-dependent peptidase